MYIDKVRLVGANTLDLPLVNVDPLASYVVKQIDGLGPTDLDVVINNTLYQGGVYGNSRPQLREIVIRLKLNPDYASGQTVSDLRTALYGLIRTGGMGAGQVQLWNGATQVAYTKAYISKFEINPFSKDPEIQITYACTSAYLISPTLTTVDTSAMSKTVPVINNSGSAPVGFHLEITLTAAASSFTLTDNDDPTIKMTITYAFVSGDKIVIDTRAGSRAIQVVRAGVTTNLIGMLSNTSTWLWLESGNNSFTTSVATFNYTLLTYTPQYWGI